jgi:hypothetical protein
MPPALGAVPANSPERIPKKEKKAHLAGPTVCQGQMGGSRARTVVRPKSRKGSGHAAGSHRSALPTRRGVLYQVPPATATANVWYQTWQLVEAPAMRPGEALAQRPRWALIWAFNGPGHASSLSAAAVVAVVGSKGATVALREPGCRGPRHRPGVLGSCGRRRAPTCG